MLGNKIGPVFNARNVVSFFVYFLFFLKKNSSSFCRENEIFTSKKMDHSLTLEKQKLDQILTLQHIYMHTYIYEAWHC